MGTEYNSFTGIVSTNSGTDTVGNMGFEFNAHDAFEIPGDIMSTVKSQQGSPVTGREVRMEDTVECHGFRMTIATAIREGFVTKDFGGNFVSTDLGDKGAKQAEAPKGQLPLASGGTAEEALASDFRADDKTEDLMTSLVQGVHPDTQLAALDSVLRNGGELDRGVVERVASQLGIEPDDASDMVSRAAAGFEDAAYRHLASFGVYDRQSFTNFLHASPQVSAEWAIAARDLVMNNSTKGLETLAAKFATTADLHDPVEVAEALNDAGIRWRRGDHGVFVLDMTQSGHGQMTFKQAVQLGLITLKRGK